MLFLEIHNFTHNNTGWENSGITARHDRISKLKLHMARQFVQIGKTRITPVPTQCSEITASQHFATQLKLRVQQRNHNGKMVGNRRHDSHDTPFGDNPHVRLHSILTAFVHCDIIGQMRDTVVHDISQHKTIRKLFGRVRRKTGKEDRVGSHHLQLIL